MATSTEQIAVWILEALREEHRRDPDWRNARTEALVFTPVRNKHKLKDSDLLEATRFLHSRLLAKFIDKPEGRCAFITQEGLEFLDAWLVAHKPKTDWVRVGVWLTLAALAAAVLIHVSSSSLAK